MEKLINEEIAGQIKELFAELNQPVEVLFFSKTQGCETCTEIEQLIGEVVELSDMVGVQVFDVESDGEIAASYHVTEAPTLVIAAKEGDQLVDYGVRFLGAPAGHEFTSLIHDLLMVSKRQSDLSDDARSFLAGLDQPVLLQVFVTPTCPYCPQAVLLAHKMAMESDLVQAEMVEATEFRELADTFNVRGVPQTTINAGAGTVVGAVPEQSLVENIQKSLGR